MNKLKSLALLSVLSLASLGGCGVSADEIRETIDEHMIDEVKKLNSDLEALKTYLCRRGDADKGVFSLRAFDGHLCEGRYVDGLDVVGGAALLVCWGDNHEEFRDSQCAERALDEYDLKTYDQQAVIQGMAKRIDGYASEAGGIKYDIAKGLFCTVPASLLGPGSAVHDLWCGAGG